MRLAFAIAAIATLAAAALPLARGDRRFVCGVEPGIPNWFGIDGRPVEAVNGRRLRIDGVTVVLPENPRTELRWACGEPDWQTVGWVPVRVGDSAVVEGALRPDGTLLAYSIYPDSYVGLPVAAGIVEAAVYDPADAWNLLAFTLRGETFDCAAVEEMDGGNDRSGAVHPVLAGDVVAVEYALREDGTRAANYVSVRQSGEGTTLLGAIESEDEEAQTVSVGGVTVHYGGASYAYDDALLSDEDSDWAIRPRRIVRVHGVLRQGLVVADFIHVLGDAPPPRKARRRAVRFHGRGIVDAVRENGATVSGLEVDAAPRGRSGRPRSFRVAPGDRVRVDGEVREGRAIATRLRRR